MRCAPPRPRSRRSKSLPQNTVGTATVIPAESLMSHVHARDGHAWHPVPDLAELAPGEVGGFLVAGMTVLACRVGDDLYAYATAAAAATTRWPAPCCTARWLRPMWCCGAPAAAHTSTSCTPGGSVDGTAAALHIWIRSRC